MLERSFYLFLFFCHKQRVVLVFVWSRCDLCLIVPHISDDNVNLSNPCWLVLRNFYFAAKKKNAFLWQKGQRPDFNAGLKVLLVFIHEASLNGFKTVGCCGEGQTHRPGFVQGQSCRRHVVYHEFTRENKKTRSCTEHRRLSGSEQFNTVRNVFYFHEALNHQLQ